jgi:hypothetical protein
MRRRRPKISHSFKKESLWEKTKWFLSLSLAERYRKTISMGEFIRLARGKTKHDRGSFKTIQVLERE